MKTNHSRNFVEEPAKPRHGGGYGAALPAGLGFANAGFNHDSTNGSRGKSKQKHGAKKRVRNLVRKTEQDHIEDSLEGSAVDTSEGALDE